MIVELETRLIPTPPMNLLRKTTERLGRCALLLVVLIVGLKADEPVIASADEPAPGGIEPGKNRLFPLMTDKMRKHIKERARELPPPYGVMALGNWLDSDWDFIGASVSLSDSPYIEIPAGETATMDLQSTTKGFKADVWVLPFVDLMIGGGRADIDSSLSLIDIPISYTPGQGVVRGDKVVPLRFDGEYYSFGVVIAGAYKRFYGAIDASWIKTSLNGDASLSADGFWTLTVSPKVGYNAGMTQFYIGARYLSK